MSGSQMQPASERPDNAHLHEVRASFASADAMQSAADRLAMSGFDRADLSLPQVDVPPEQATPESSAKPADTDEDARQARTLHTSMGASIAALAAAGVVSFMLYATALEDGSVTVATAAVVLAETVPPAVVGIMFLGDHTRPGMGGVAVLGFSLAVVCAVALARFGETDEQGLTAAQRRVRQAEADPSPYTAS